jgi:MoaA/NifB/PqqE/SkfB family radical SAM enzyme
MAALDGGGAAQGCSGPCKGRKEGIMMASVRQELHYQYRCLRLARSFLSRRFVHVNLQVTYRCNFQCGICSFWSEQHPLEEELSVAQIRAIGQKLSRLGTLIVSLGGGEPLLRPDLYDVTLALNETGHFPILITNGWFVDDDVARDILRAGLQEISVSVDYADAAKHDALRGKPGAWERAIRALELLRRHRPDRRNRIHMIAVLLEDNLDDIEPLLRLCRDLGVTFFINMYSSGRGARPPRVPGSDVARQLIDLKARYPEFVSLTSYIERFDEALARGGIGDCAAGQLMFNIGSRGELSRCIDTLEQPVGNILHDDLDELIARLRRHAVERPCAGCWTSCRGFAESMFRPPRLRQLREFYTSVKPH